MTSAEKRERPAVAGRTSPSSAIPVTAKVSIQSDPQNFCVLTNWREADSPVDTLVSLVAVFRSPRVGGRLDGDTITALRKIARLDPCRTRADLLAALVDADAADLETVRRILTRHGWPDTVMLPAAMVMAWRSVVEQRRRYLAAQLECARTVATRCAILAAQLELELEAL